MKIDKINLGEIIRQKVEEKRISKAKFAESVGIARQNIEKTVFLKHGLDTDLLCRISEVLDCNFFDYFRDLDSCNKINDKNEEVRATLSLEMGKKKKDVVMRFKFGENNIEILNP